MNQLNQTNRNKNQILRKNGKQTEKSSEMEESDFTEKSKIKLLINSTSET